MVNDISIALANETSGDVLTVRAAVLAYSIEQSKFTHGPMVC